MAKKRKVYSITIEWMIHCYEQMNGELSNKEKSLIKKWETGSKNPKSCSLEELKFIRKIKEFQLEILDVTGCSALEIII